MSTRTNRSVSNVDAVFIGWQQTPWGKPLALYNITVIDHPLYGSTVCEETLREFHLQIPQISSRLRPAKKVRPSLVAQ